MTNNIKKTYSEEEKKRLVARMLAPEKCPIAVLSKETGICQSTLSTWKSKALGNVNSNKQGRPSKKLSTRDKLLVVMETYSMSEIELSK